MRPEDEGSNKPVTPQSSSFVHVLSALLAGLATAAVALPAGLFGILYFGGVHSDSHGRWFGPPLVIASFALLSAPLWVARAAWRSSRNVTAAGRDRA